MAKMSKVHGKVALEQSCIVIEVVGADVARCAQNKVLNADEKRYYTMIRDKLLDVEAREENPRRKLVVFYPEQHEAHCITFIQVLDDGMIAAMRSSVTSSLASDLGFLCRLALDRKLPKVVLTIGSLHTYLEDGASA
jgi:hypothetical protein